jgi:iron complex outermembrane receptor protein
MSLRTRVAPWITAVLTVAAPRLALGGAEPATPAALGDLELEALLALPVDTVSTASKRPQKLSSAPASVTVITAAEIEAYGYRTLGEALDGVRGLYTSSDRNYAYLGVRGFSRSDYNARVLLLLDGHRINDDIYDSASIGTEGQVDLALVDRIEIVRGPGSALYGGNAVFGVINVITKRPTRAAGAEVQAGVASAGTGTARATYGLVREDVEALVSATGYASRGRDLAYPEYAGQGPRGDGVARGADRDRYASGLAKLSWGRLTLEAAGDARRKGVPTGAYGAVFGDTRAETLDARWFAELRWERPPEPGAAGVFARVYWDEYSFHQRFPLSPGGAAPATVVNRDEALGRWTGGEVRGTWHLGERAVAVAGAELQVHLRQDQWNRDEGAGGALWMSERHGSTSGGAYASLEAQPWSWLEVVTGVRYDQYEIFGGALSPRAAVLLRPWDATVLKVLYGRAFRPPNAAELYYENPNSWEPPPHRLRPEVIDTGEVVLEQELGAGARATLVGYEYRVRDLISDVTDPATGMGQTVNGGSARATGAEAELEWRRGAATAAGVSWTVQRATEASTGRLLPNSPMHLAKLHLRAPLGWRLRGGLEVLYLGPRRTLADTTVPGYGVANLTLAARGLWRGSLDLVFQVLNALDRSYSDPARVEHLQAAIPQDGRSFRLDAIYRF